MVDVNFGLGQNNALSYFQFGQQMGQQSREKQDQRELRNALATVSGGQSSSLVAGDQTTKQTDAAMRTIMQLNPQLGMKLSNDRREQQQHGDAEMAKAIGQATLDVMNRPVKQRAAAWDAYVDHFAQTNPKAVQYKGKFNDQLGLSILAETGLTQEYQKSQQPSYMAIPEGGTLVNTRDPSAVSQFGAPPQPAQPQAPKIIPQRPAGMDDAALISQAREAIKAGAPATEVFQRLQAWGVNP